jgi:hypothetical protein
MCVRWGVASEPGALRQGVVVDGLVRGMVVGVAAGYAVGVVTGTDPVTAAGTGGFLGGIAGGLAGQRVPKERRADALSPRKVDDADATLVEKPLRHA